MAKKPAKKEEQLLYYYCDIESFMGIVQNKCLWLSNIFFLNDSLEHRWFRNIVKDELDKAERKRELRRNHYQEKNDAAGAEQEEKERKFLARLNEMTTSDHHFTNHAVACFSEHADALSQWRGYGDDGHGVAIGFDIGALRYDPAVSLVKVEYKKEKQKKKAEQLVSKATTDFRNDPSKQGEALQHFQRNVWEYAARCKNGAFHEEKEWRLIYNPKQELSLPIKATLEGVKFRRRGKDIIPYHCWPIVFSDLHPPIRRVILGPKNLKVEQKLIIESFLYMSKTGEPDVKRSALSYR